MATVVDSGKARNLTTMQTRDGLTPDPAEHRFVTFINELGALHTIIVEVDHAAKDAEQLLKWFEHTKAAAALTHGDPTSSLFKTPEEILKIADQAIGIAEHATEGEGQQDTTRQEGSWS